MIRERHYNESRKRQIQQEVKQVRKGSNLMVASLVAVKADLKESDSVAWTAVTMAVVMAERWVVEKALLLVVWWAVARVGLGMEQRMER